MAKTSGVAPNHARQAGEPAPITEVKQKAAMDSKGGATSSRADGATPDGAAATPDDPGYKEPALPRLSAEALATALMTAEPDKAVVPRVLPSGMAEGD